MHGRIPLLICAVVLGASLAHPVGVFAQCGVERWSIKTGTDAGAGSVDLSGAAGTTIASVIAPSAPNPIPSTTRVAPFETTLWTINASLIRFKLEGDSDYHLVLSDSGGKTMIVEIPSPDCVGSGSPFLSAITNARAQFDARFTPTSSFQNVSIPVRVIGVGMFDFLHGQSGVAPNGAELHPVLDIAFNPSTTSDFALAAAPTSVSVAQGKSKTVTLTSSIVGSFASAVALAASGAPAGTGVNLSPTSIAGGAGSSTMTLSVGASTAVGTYSITVTGSGGGKTHTATISLTVTSGGGGSQQLLANPGFESGATGWSATAGVIDNSSGEPAHSGQWKGWLDGYGMAHTDTLSQQVTLPASIASATLSFWLHIDTAETTTTRAFDTLQVQIQGGSGTTTLATFSNLDAAAGFSQKTFDLTAFAGQTVTLLLTGTEGSINQTSFVVDDFSLVVQ
jgi:hypothetical protein